MTDDPATATEPTSADAGDSGARGPAYLQIVEVEAGPLEAGDAIERPDEYGRIPVVVRIRRQPPINPVWIVVAIGLGASGLFLPLADALRAMVIVVAVVVLVVGIASRLFMRIPPGTVGLVARAGRHQGVREAGVNRVSPFLALTHVVTTRELAFDVPVAAVRSSDGVNVNVDLVLTLGIGDPVKLVYSITTRDIDQFVHATTQDGVRTMIRGIEALSALDLGAKEAAILRATIDDKLAAFGVNVRAVAFTRVLLPEALTASLEARRLAVIQLARGARELRARAAPGRRPGEPHRPGAGGAQGRDRDRGRGRGDAPVEARGAPGCQPDGGPLRPGDGPPARGAAAGRQHPGGRLDGRR